MPAPQRGQRFGVGLTLPVSTSCSDSRKSHSSEVQIAIGIVISNLRALAVELQKDENREGYAETYAKQRSSY
jgi:hypothetical protein